MNSSTIKDINAYWASMVATMLDDLTKAFEEGDRKARCVAVARVGQVGQLMHQYFSKRAADLSMVAGAMDPDSFLAAAKAAKKIVEFHEKKIDKVGRVDNVVEANDGQQDYREFN